MSDCFGFYVYQHVDGGGWYHAGLTPDDEQGPFATEEEAWKALGVYVDAEQKARETALIT